jgi:dolichol-phosphate mannosyltransferase
LLSFLLNPLASGFTLVASATAGARLTSSLMNFFLNRKVVFHSDDSLGKTLLRYYALAVPIALSQMLLTHGINTLFGIDESLVGLRAVIYAVVMTVLYLVSFLVQQRWVFSKKQRNSP